MEGFFIVGESVTPDKLACMPKAKPPTISDRVEHLLRIYGELHIDDLKTKLNEDGGKAVGRRVLQNTMTHWLAFKLTKPSTYALMKEKA